ncbi:exonuclease [Mycobacterium phage DyoEdafos]|uniref:Cas4 family exonuclease n=1 Tax=Mycobacterium phage DyoEdafos TaxID=2599860 RepID=A0A5J6THN4_9CAUD|nr:exonuclease [Mycobacterium phage DyoEdafos]QFG10290.1 Cas4 family exonuclease [Mycobacterium phage DyoEdafos]
MYPDGYTAGDPNGVWREGRGRDGKQKRWWYTKDGKGYSRASGAGKGLDTKDGLIDWAACQAAVGILLDASARSEVATLINEYDADPWYKGDDGGTRSGKERLKAAVEKARNVAGQHTAASAGTEFHKLGELRNKGESPRIVQDHLKEPLAQYDRAVEPIEFLEQEMLVVNDHLELCGSVDYLMGLPPGITTPDGEYHEDSLVVVGDLKTGRWDAKRPMSVTCQLTAYGTGVRYDQETNTRTPLHPRINNKWGVMVHFPIMTKNPKVRFYWVDLTLGLKASLLAKEVEAMRRVFSSKDSELKELNLDHYQW